MGDCEQVPGKVPAPSPRTRALFEEKGGIGGSFEWLSKPLGASENRGMTKLHILVRYIIYILIGWTLLAIPGLISFFLFTKRVVEERVFLPNTPLSFTSSGDIVFERYIADGFSIEGFPVFIYCVFLAARYSGLIKSSWMFFWFCLYAFIVIPEIIVRITNLVCEALDAKQTAIKILRCNLPKL
jgi:hypothetical protein